MPLIPQSIFLRFFYWLMASTSLYVTLWQQGDLIWSRNFLPEVQDGHVYDFIVVGGGSAGAVVASRLSEKYRVLLLEAGGAPVIGSGQMPGFALQQLNEPRIDWMHRTVPQQNACLALNNQESGWSQGKGLGGTSSINFMIHSRGHPKDFDNWAELTGDQRWSYDNLVPFFKKSEDFAGEYNESELHATGGPIRVEVPPFTSGGSRFVEAAQELGYSKVDVNGNFSEGFDLAYLNVRHGRRQDTYWAYLFPVFEKRTETLQLAKWSTATKILMRGEDNEAYGVEFIHKGIEMKAFASKEIIISAGAVNSPKLLMVSGIGPKDHLESLNIEVKVNLPSVGSNLQDHIATYLGPFFVAPGESFLLDRDITFMTLTNYFSTGEGPLASSGVHALGFISTNLTNPAESSEPWPDIQLIYSGLAAYKNFPHDFAKAFHINEDIFSEYYSHAIGQDSFMIIVSLARPFQRGEIKLKSPDPMEEPLIDPKYLQDERDVERIVEGIKFAVNLVENTLSFQSINASFTSEVFPGCEEVEFRSDEYWECYVRHLTVTLHHIVGTCSMGKAQRSDSEFEPDDLEFDAEDKAGVVDTELKVKGVKGLRVIDASVMPVVPIGNTNAPTAMIGERGADLILQQWEGVKVE